MRFLKCFEVYKEFFPFDIEEVFCCNFDIKKLKFGHFVSLRLDQVFRGRKNAIMKFRFSMIKSYAEKLNLKSDFR